MPVHSLVVIGLMVCGGRESKFTISSGMRELCKNISPRIPRVQADQWSRREWSISTARAHPSGSFSFRSAHEAFGRNGQQNSLHRVCATGLPWAADNAAFGGQWDTERFEKAVFFKIPAAPTRPLFIVVPDVVGDSRATLALFHIWRPRLSATGLLLALVLQDGVEHQLLPWELFSWVFVGGSRKYASGVWGKGPFDEWKESRAAADVIREARRRGKQIHAGRVNGLRRLRHFFDLGVDTADGSSLSLYPDTLVPQFVAALQKWEAERGHAATATGYVGCAQVDREVVQHDC